MKKILIIFFIGLSITANSQSAITFGFLTELRIFTDDYTSDDYKPLDISSMSFGLIYNDKYFSVEGGVLLNFPTKNYYYITPTIHIPIDTEEFNLFISYKILTWNETTNTNDFIIGDIITGGLKLRGYGGDIQLSLGLSTKSPIFLVGAKFSLRPWRWILNF